jgi:glycerophosphoryl diester phosphodiesterase
MQRLQVSRPLVFAHRGACRVAPENTLPAFAAAIEQKADGVELDVQLSSDGVPVICHNSIVDGTSNGKGRLSQFTLSQLRSLDFGGWFAPAFAGTLIPTLDEALDCLSGRALVNIELKSAGLHSYPLARAVIERVRAHAMAGQVVISSFNPLALRQARLAAPEIEGGLLLAPELPAVLRWSGIRAWSRATALHPKSSMVDAAYVARARTLRFPLRVWTVDDPARQRRLIEFGVDSIITNRPELLIALLEQRAKEYS